MASLFRIPPPMDDSTRIRCDTMIRLVENACSEMLISPDWTLNMQIVDDLNREQAPVVVTEVIRVLRKRLGSGNLQVLSVGLTLAETLVKNCGAPVHGEIASERFMTAVAKIARIYSFKTNRESMAIADQALDIIQAWGEAFLSKRREFPLFVDTYHELRAEGLPFSEQYQSDRPPVLDPGGGSLLDRPSAAGGRSMAASSRAGNGDSGDGGRPGGGPGETGVGAAQETSGPHELRELSVSDREIVATGASCSEMLEQVLQAAESRAEVRDSDITAEVVEQLKQTGPKIANIIEANGEGDAGMLSALFKVNDAVDSALRLHKDVVEGKKSVPLLPASSFSSNIGAISSGVENLSVTQAAGVRTAASKLKKNIPTLSGPPSDKKGGKSNPSPGQKAAPDETPDLLSGFELDGASNSHANRSSVKGSKAAGTAADMFADFAAPAAGVNTPGAGEDWVVVGGAGAGAGAEGQGQVQEQPLGGTFAGPQQPQEQQQWPVSQGFNAAAQPFMSNAPAAPPSAASKAQNLMDNLGALYAGGSSTTNNPGNVGMGPMANNSMGSNIGIRWAGGVGAGGGNVGGGQGGSFEPSPFDAIGSLGAQPQQPYQQQQPQQQFQQQPQQQPQYQQQQQPQFQVQQPVYQEQPGYQLQQQQDYPQQQQDYPQQQIYQQHVQQPFQPQQYQQQQPQHQQQQQHQHQQQQPQQQQQQPSSF